MSDIDAAIDRFDRASDESYGFRGGYGPSPEKRAARDALRALFVRSEDQMSEIVTAAVAVDALEFAAFQHGQTAAMRGSTDEIIKVCDEARAHLRSLLGIPETAR
jgi:hypothetical protein